MFVAPQSWVQAAMACIFAFGILLGFELMRPHLDPADAWLYRLVREKHFVGTNTSTAVVIHLVGWVF